MVKFPDIVRLQLPPRSLCCWLLSGFCLSPELYINPLSWWLICHCHKLTQKGWSRNRMLHQRFRCLWWRWSCRQNDHCTQWRTSIHPRAAADSLRWRWWRSQRRRQSSWIRASPSAPTSKESLDFRNRPPSRRCKSFGCPEGTRYKSTPDSRPEVGILESKMALKFELELRTIHRLEHHHHFVGGYYSDSLKSDFYYFCNGSLHTRQSVIFVETMGLHKMKTQCLKLKIDSFNLLIFPHKSKRYKLHLLPADEALLESSGLGGA